MSCFACQCYAVTVLKLNDDVYIRTSYLSHNVDKVWRLKVGKKRGPQGQGVVDFIGERLIYWQTPLNRTIPEYHKTQYILRYGGDESPPLWVDSKIIGGNHLLNGQSTVHNYKFNMTLDGKTLKESIHQTGKVIRINETYLVSFGDENNILGEVENSYEFSSKYYSNFQYTYTAMENLNTLIFGGMQFQRPYVEKGGQINILSPNSRWNKWVELLPPKIISMAADLWSPILGSREFIVKTNNKKARYFVMGYCKGVIQNGLDEALYVSKYGKIYPKAVNLIKISVGDLISITGCFGFIPSDEVLFKSKPCTVIH